LHLILRHEIRVFRVQLTRGAACRTKQFEGGDGRVSPAPAQMRVGPTASLQTLCSPTSASESGFGSSWHSWLRVPADPFRSRARIGQTRKRPIDFWITTALAKPRSSRGISKRQRTGTATSGPILVLRDTTEFTFKRGGARTVGIARKAVAGAYRDGALRYYASCGIFMHSSLAITTEGLPLGLTAIKFWNRDKFKGTNKLKRSINPTRVPIEAS